MQNDEIHRKIKIKRRLSKQRPILKSFVKLAIIILLALPYTQALTISEIMFNPQGSDAGREWIEVQVNASEGCVNLSQYRLYEEQTKHNIYPLSNDIACKRAVICNDPAKFFMDNPQLNSSESNISVYKSAFSLSNSGEELGLVYDDIYIDYMNYSLLLQYISVQENYTLERMYDIWQQSHSSGGTCGIAAYDEAVNNTANITNTSEKPENSMNISDLINTSNSNLTLSNSTLELKYSSGTFDNTTGSSSENSTKADWMHSTECTVSLRIITNETPIYSNDAPIRWKNRLEFNGTKTTNYSIEYWIEDSSGQIIRNKALTNNQDEKSFTPKITEKDAILFIKSTIKSADCDILDGEDEKIILIYNAKYMPPTCNCESRQTKCESKECDCPDTKIYQACKTDEIPSVKIMNVCNNTAYDSNAQNSTASINQTQSLFSASLAYDTKKDVKGMTTGMIVYESPNIKNRFYALIGLVLVGIVFIILSLYKQYRKLARQV